MGFVILLLFLLKLAITQPAEKYDYIELAPLEEYIEEPKKEIIIPRQEKALSVLEKVQLIKYAESLGGTETLITYPTTQTHADVSEELCLKNGITPNTLRLSVGLENADDLIADLEQALA